MIPAMPIEEFRVHVPDGEIEDLHRRLESARLPDQLAGSGWGYGTDRDTLAEWITHWRCLLYTSPSPRDATLSRMPSSA